MLAAARGRDQVWIILAMTQADRVLQAYRKSILQEWRVVDGHGLGPPILKTDVGLVGTTIQVYRLERRLTATGGQERLDEEVPAISNEERE